MCDDHPQDRLPSKQKKRLKRKAVKELKKEAKKRKLEEGLHLPGADTIQPHEIAETEIFIYDGTI